MKKVIYLSVTGNYDKIIQPEAIDESFDYICFTDSLIKTNDGVWQFRLNPYKNKDNKRTSVWARMHPHIILPEYDYSLYIDANVCILDKAFYERVNKRIECGDLISQVPHPTRNCIYLELEQCFNIRKITPWQYIKHHQKYLRANLPHDFGLFEDNVILRKHNDSKVLAIDESWWNEYCQISNRDQLSLMLVYWKHNFKPSYLMGKETTRNSKYVKCVNHQGGQTTGPCNYCMKVLNYCGRAIFVPIYRKLYGIEHYYSQW